MLTNGYRDFPIRVVHVVPQFNPGGQEQLLVVEFAKHTNRERFDLRFLGLGSRGDLAGDIEACGHPVTALDVRPGLHPTLVARLAWLFQRWNIDVVHTHYAKPLLYAAPAARLLRVPALIHTRHGPSDSASGRITTAFRLACRLADRVVCVSEHGTRRLAQEGMVRKALTTIWNGIDVDRFAYGGPRSRGPALLVGRLYPEQNVETLLRATKLAVQEDPSFRLEIAGDGPCLPALRRLSSELGLMDHVRFLGEIRDVPALMARASLLVQPSLSDDIPLTMLEAMARGLPVIATQIGGNPEIVVDGQTGLLVSARSETDFASAMLRLRNDPEGGRRMGEAGRNRVRQHFDSRQMVAAYEAIYLDLLGHRCWRGRGEKVRLEMTRAVVSDRLTQRV